MLVAEVIRKRRRSLTILTHINTELKSWIKRKDKTIRTNWLMSVCNACIVAKQYVVGSR